MYKYLRPVKIKRIVKSLQPEKIRRMVKSLRPEKIRQMVKSLRPMKIRRMVKSLHPEKIRRISNCWLLPDPADEHVHFLVDVMNLACSLQMRRELWPPWFFGRTLSRTVPAVCTGPPCQEMTQIQAATKSLASAWNSTDFCQIKIIPNSAYKCHWSEKTYMISVAVQYQLSYSRPPN